MGDGRAVGAMSAADANADIIAKIRKLMALGASPSEAEASSALEKARVLLARYGLSLADVDAKSPEIVENALLDKKRLRAWESHLIFVIAQATFTQALHICTGKASRVLIIGREANAVSAAELFSYLHLAVLKLGRAHSAEVAHLESFKLGVVHRIGERLSMEWTEGENDGERRGKKTDRRAEKGARADNHEADDAPSAEDKALTIRMAETAARENDAYIAEKYGKTRSRRSGRGVEPSSFARGRAAGDGVSLNRQLK